jgi:hypothetical protein
MTPPPAGPRYEVARQGNPLGVHELAEIAQLLAQGSLRWSDDCWTEGMEGWCKLSDLKDPIEAAAAGSPVPTRSRRPLLRAGVVTCVALAVGVAAYCLSGGTEEGSAVGPSAPKAPRASPLHTPQQKALRVALSETQQQIHELVAGAFVENRGEGSGQVTYIHRFYVGVGNRIPLRVYVDASGRRHLHTYYRGKTWLFHNQLRFVIGKQTWETAALPAYKAKRELEDDNQVTESCHFLADNDTLLVDRLASAAQAPIQMQLLGRKPVTLTLSFETKQALQQSAELAALLTKRQSLLRELRLDD